MRPNTFIYGGFSDYNELSHSVPGYYDERGLFYITDRLKELIKVKGLQVAPAELEALLLTHPKIADAAVIGIPNEWLGEAPKAFVVRKDESLSEKEVEEFVAEKVGNGYQNYNS